MISIPYQTFFTIHEGGLASLAISLVSDTLVIEMGIGSKGQSRCWDQLWRPWVQRTRSTSNRVVPTRGYNKSDKQWQLLQPNNHTTWQYCSTCTTFTTCTTVCTTWTVCWKVSSKECVHTSIIFPVLGRIFVFCFQKISSTSDWHKITTSLTFIYFPSFPQLQNLPVDGDYWNEKLPKKYFQCAKIKIISWLLISQNIWN